VEDYKGRAGLETVRVVGGQKNDDEGEEVRRGGEGLRGYRMVAHVVQDSGKEDGHAAEGNVAAKEHKLRGVSKRTTCFVMTYLQLSGSISDP
jgi:hypothetical protein